MHGKHQRTVQFSHSAPFIKSKLDNRQADYEKEIKNLDKQIDIIKTAYIKGVLKLNDFDKEIKHIEYKRTELTNKLKEQKQYDNLSFTVADLLIIQDKTYVNPQKFIENIYNWVNETREKSYKSNPDIDITKTKNNIELVPLFEKYIKGFYNLTKEYKKEYDKRMETMRYDRKKTFKQMVDDSNNVVADELLFTSDNYFFKNMNKKQIRKWADLVWNLFMKI